MKAFFRSLYTGRPWWMTAMFAFCVFMTFAYVPWDLLWKPVHEDVEVWFGFVFRGWAAKVTGPLHWMIYALGAFGFWKMRPWMHPWAALYVAQIAIGMGVWGLSAEASPGWYAALVPFVVFAGLALLLWRARDRWVDGEP